MLFELERPKTLDQVIGRAKEIESIRKLIASKDGIPHICFSGKQGTGKTTLAYIIANEVLGDNKGSNFYEFNASSTRGIEFIRNDITEIAKRRPLCAKYKIILMDEADNITPDAQQCLRRILEIYSSTTRFIFTCNYPYRIIEPVLSRFVHFHFEPIATIEIAKQLKRISNKHKFNYSNDELKQFAKSANGDMRKAINLLEGNVNTESHEILNNLTIEKIKNMDINDKIQKLAFDIEPDLVFSKLLELVQLEKRWDLLYPMAECNYKMNMSVHKNLFIANLLEKYF